MPLLLRTVDPSHVSRGTLPDRFQVPNDLEAVANGTLANVIRQLSALSHHAEELFTDLISVGTEIAHRASNLQARIDRLAVRVGHIDAVQEESPSIHESLNTKPFTSSMSFDQQVVSRHTLPPAMLKTFQLCDVPPPLDRLNKYRDDGRDGLKFYTDPSYFFDLWRQEMLKDTEKAIDRGKKPHKPKQDGQNRHKKRVRQPHNTRERQRHLAIEQGEHLMASPTNEYRNQHNNSSDMESHEGGYSYPTPPSAETRGSYGRPNNVEYEENSHLDYNAAMLLQQHQQHHQHQNQHQQQYEAYQRYYASQTTPNSNYESPTNNNYRSSRNTNVNGYRPSQPPPAPPPSYLVGSPGGVAMSPQSNNVTNNVGMNHNNRTPTNRTTHRETLPPPPPPPSEANMNGIYPPPPPEEEPLPPPPPTPNEHSMLRPPSLPEEHLPPSPPPPPMDEIPSHSQAPPPPPPPPPGNSKHTPPLENGNIKTKKTTRTSHVPVVRDGRDELLRAIRDGIALRKVEATNDSKADEKPTTFHDVASILARRVAVEMSDSDSGSSEYDSDAWDEASA